MADGTVTVSEKFKEWVWLDYPMPKEFSIWGGDMVHTLPIENLDQLIIMCVEDVASDILIRGSASAYEQTTSLPKDTVTVMYANLAFPYQGNRQVKVSYDHTTKKAFLRYFPAEVVYQRKMHIEDIDLLQGDRLIFFRSFVLAKMATLELSYLKTTSMNIDNGSIDLNTLEKFAESMTEKVNKLKEDTILMYSVSNG